MTPEENKKIVSRLFAVILNPAEFHRTREFLTPDFVRHDITKLFPDRFGINAVDEHMSGWLAAVPDLQVDAVDVVAEGDRVCIRYIAYGTHTGTLLGQAGTGKPIKVDGINIYRLVDGKIAETWQFMDALNLLRQIGLLPSGNT